MRNRSVICLILAFIMTFGVVLSGGMAFAVGEGAVAGTRENGANDISGGSETGDGELRTAGSGPVLVAITSQPGNITVSYPEGASFAVEVDHPENVASYRWELRDGDGEASMGTVVLDGQSAKTGTLVIPSTVPETDVSYLRCVITDKNGNEIVSQDASLTIANPNEQKAVLYVGEYAVCPGETLDLADTSLGSGRVTYDADGVNITFESFRFNNSTPVFDSTFSPGTGIFLYSTAKSSPEFRMHFKGECVIDNRYLDTSSNSGGVTLNSFFGVSDETNKTTLRIDGDGKLTLKGGQYGIYSDGNVELGANIRILPMDKNRCSGIRAHGIIIDSGVTADITSYGSGLTALGDLRILDGATLNIDATVPRFSTGYPSAAVVDVYGSVSIRNAAVNLKGKGDPELVVPYNTTIADLTGLSFVSGLNIEGSKVDIQLSALHSNKSYAFNFCGISGNWEAGVALYGGSSVSVSIAAPEVTGATGVITGGNISVDKNCELKVNIGARGSVRGIVTDGKLLVEDATVDVSASTSTDDGEYGVICGGASVNITDGKYYVRSAVKDGVAFIAKTGRAVSGAVTYDKNYNPAMTELKGKAALVSPADGAVSSYGFKEGSGITLSETVYDTTDTSAPATEVLITEGGHKVTFNSNGGSVVKSQIVADGGKAVKPEDPFRVNYAFDGWYKDDKLTEAFDFNTSIKGDITVYAKWKDVSGVTYTVTDGANSTWKKGSTAGVTLTLKRSEDDEDCFDYFSGVEIDGTALTKGTDYTIKSRSNTVTLNAAALEKLKTGSHTVTIKFDDGKAETMLTVTTKSSSGSSGTPGTHDMAGTALWIAMMAAGAAGAASLLIIRKKRRAAER